PPPHTSLLSFSFYDYDPHPELHSFPTRRSSDLFGSYAVQCMHFANSPKQRAEQPRQSKLATAAHHRALKFALFCQQLSQASSGAPSPAAAAAATSRTRQTLPHLTVARLIHVTGVSV